MPAEIKSGSIFSNDWTAALRKLSALFGDAALPPGIVHGGEGWCERDAVPRRSSAVRRPAPAITYLFVAYLRFPPLK
jgi:hypothetical protein